jgi:recombinational DNA repair ATPase RecF
VIQVEALLVEDFRGIRRLELQLGCKSFAVWGPNGSGKSGVVDAINFALTGTIARLSGTGTGTVSVLRHGPHVLQRNNAEAAKVSLTLRDTVSGQTGVLTRCVKSAGSFTLSHDTPELRVAVEQARQHPELTLSRREIIQYILTEPGARAQAIQALLKLDRLDHVRRLLVSARNKAAEETAATNRELIAAELLMSRHLGLTDLSVADVTSEINQRRALLGLQLITEVTAGSDLRSGVNVAVSGPVFNKASAIRDVQALATAIASRAPSYLVAARLSAVLSELSGDPTILDALRHRALVTMGLDLVSEPVCPLCDMHWDAVEELRTHLREKLKRSDAAADLEQRIHTAASELRTELGGVADLAQTARPRAAGSADSELSHRLQAWALSLTELSGKLQSVDGTVAEIPRISSDVLSVPAGVTDGIAALLTRLQERPDQSAEEAAQTFLTVAQDRWVRVRLAQESHAEATTTEKTASSIYDTYCTVTDEALTNLYRTVESDFSGYYRQINAEDESSFTARLQPSAGKLDFKVDFYGIDMFPPAAYHSEGHQDGMGVCLYLALEKQILGEEFRFAVLDDVVMSVDSHHRRQFCRLLKDTFPNVQFIMTTHDEVWARQMQSSGLIERKSQARFHGWTVSDGPVYEQGGDVWARIGADLGNDDVPAAAHKLRRYLETVAGDIAEALRARVPYRPGASYDLGELLSAVKGRHNDLLKKATKSATSWNNPQAIQLVEDLKDQRAKVIPGQEDESWVINKLVHNNDWAPMVSSDFHPVVDASHRLLDLFACSNLDCGSWIYVVGPPGNEDSLRCSCGAYNLNLQTK